MQLISAGAVQGEEAVTLEPIVVEGEESAEDQLVVRKTSSATKTNTSIVDTSQSISIVSRKQLDDQNPKTVGESLRYTSGVLSDRDSNSRYDSVFIRGFGGFGTSTHFVDILDGLKLPRGQGFAQTSIDPYLLNRVDVLKGPSAVLYGQTSPGGLINQVSLAPSDESFNEVRAEVGTHGRVKGGITSRGKLIEDGSLQYSISGLGFRTGTRYEDVDQERVGVAPALTWQPNENTKLTLSGYYQKDPEGGYFNSLYPDFLASGAFSRFLDRDFNIGDPDFDSFERDQYGVGYALEHSLDNSITLRSKLRYSGIDIDFQSLQMAGAPDGGGNIARNAIRSIEDARGLSMDHSAEFNFETGPVSHKALVGLDYQFSRSNWEYRFAAGPSINVVTPVYGQAVGALATIINNEQTLQQTGLYLQDQFEFGAFKATLGIRHDWSKQEIDNRLTSSSSDQSSRSFSYRAGLLYQFRNGMAPYASYSTSFEPVVGVDAGGSAFDPTEAEQFEIGLKYEPGFADALVTASLFHIRQENVLTPGPTPGFNVQTGEIRSRGAELEIKGNITSNLELIGAVTFLDTEVTKTNTAAALGKHPQAVPQYFASLWANYGFTEGFMKGISIGGGLRLVGSSYADDANTIKADGYAVADASLRYDFGVIDPKFEGLQFTLNATNLFDKEYYSSCSFNTFCQFGEERQIVTGLRYRW